MPIDKEISVGRVLVLADASTDHRCAFHPREAALDPCSRAGDGFGCRCPILSVRIDRWTMFVDAHFEARVLDLGNAVNTGGTIDPRRRVGVPEAIVTGWRAEVDDRLARRTDEAGQRRCEYRRQPWTAREHEGVASDFSAAGEADRAKPA